MINTSSKVSNQEERAGLIGFLFRNTKRFLPISAGLLSAYLLRNGSYKQGYELGFIDGYRSGVSNVIGIVKVRRRVESAE